MTDSFRALVENLRVAASEAVAEGLYELHELYRLMPGDVLAGVARNCVGLALLAYDDPNSEVLRNSVRHIIATRYQQGLPLADSLAAITLPRRALVKLVCEAYPSESHYEGIERLTRGIEHVSRMVMEAYEEKLSKANEEKLAAERRYTKLFEDAPIMIHAVDAETRLLDVNAEWLSVLGYTREEVIGHRSVDFMTEESRQRGLGGNFPRLLREGYIRDVQYQFVKKNGEVVETLASAIAVKNEDGTFDRVWGILRDMTERVRIEREMRESEDRYRMLVEGSPVAKCIHRAGRIVYGNPAFLRLIGANSIYELLGKELLELAPQSAQDEIFAHIEEASDSSSLAQPFSSQILRMDGKILDVEVVGQQVQYDGQPAIQFVYIDITARKQAEAASLRAAANERTLALQEDMIRALSSPLIPFGKGAVLMPLIGHINAGRAIRIVETLADGVVAHQASIAILDVTGVPNVDAEVADALLRAASVVRLLGANVMLTGIQPATARIIVELGIDMSGFTVKSSLRDGLAYVMANREWRKGL